MYEKVTQITGKEKGLTSIILAGIHGDEKCGLEAFENLLPDLEINSGVCWFGYGNPRAIEANRRYAEANLNRMFADDSSLTQSDKESYEYNRAQFLKDYLDKADALLDIHASSIPKSRAFAICEPNAKDLVNFLPVNLVVSGFDKVEPGGTDYYMNSNGKIGICLECGYLGDTQSINIAKESIFAFLKTRGHIENNAKPQQQSYVRMYRKYFTKTSNFTLSRPFENFEVLEKDQIIGIDGREEIKAPKESMILFAHNCNKSGSEAFLLGEQKESLV